MMNRGSAIRWVLVLAIGFGFFGSIPVSAAKPTTPGARFLETGNGARNAPFEIAPRRCPKAGPVGEVEGKTYGCGILTVPENYDEPDGRMITITFEVFLSTSLSPAPDPVVYLHGGPGGNAIGRAQTYASAFSGLREVRDVILFDQRGAKYSSRIDCNPYLLMLQYLIDTDDETRQLFVDYMDENGLEALGELQLQTFYSVCAESLAESGVDLTQYNSAVSAIDIESLMTSLGYREYNLYGISYGTRLALTAMRDRPERIRSVVLDSTYPLSVDRYEILGSQTHTAVERLFRNCADEPDCAEAYPELEERLAEALDFFAASDEEMLAVVLDVIAQINTDPRVPQYIPRMIYELSDGSTETLEGIVSGEIFETELPDDLSEAEELLITASQLQRDALQLLQQASEQEQANRPGARWFGAYLDAVEDLPSEEDRTFALLGALILPSLSTVPDPEWLSSLVTEFLPRSEQKAMLDDLDELSGDELWFVYDLVADLSDALTGAPFTQGAHYAVECNEEIPFNNERQSKAVTPQLAMPALGLGQGVAVTNAFAICDVFASGTADDVEDKAVESDIPTLVLSGEYDVQTPSEWGEIAAETLPNSFFIEFPNTGHGVILFSICARDVAQAFLNNPALEPISNCTGDLTTQFVTD